MLVQSLALGALLTSSAFAWPEPSGKQCSPNVIALATGIHLNIQGQYAEYNGTLALINIEAQKPINQTAFEIAKGELISDVQAGMNLRYFNQQIAPPGNPAIPGLAKYKAAQQAEAALAAGLTGNPSHDTKSLDTLKSDIMAGIKLNENNLKKATSVCDFTLQFPPADEQGNASN